MAIPKKMTVALYITRKRQFLLWFEEYWQVGMADKPDEFPDVLPEGDWDEQLALFAEKLDELITKEPT